MMSLLFSHGLTMKSNAPRFIPSTARGTSAYAVKSTTCTVLYSLLISSSQNSPSLPVLISLWKFISRSTVSGLKSEIREISSFGEAMASVSAKCIGRSIFNAERIPALSSTTSIFPFSFAILSFFSLLQCIRSFAVPPMLTVMACVSYLIPALNSHRDHG